MPKRDNYGNIIGDGESKDDGVSMELEPIFDAETGGSQFKSSGMRKFGHNNQSLRVAKRAKGRRLKNKDVVSYVKDVLCPRLRVVTSSVPVRYIPGDNLNAVAATGVISTYSQDGSSPYTLGIIKSDPDFQSWNCFPMLSTMEFSNYCAKIYDTSPFDATNLNLTPAEDGTIQVNTTPFSNEDRKVNIEYLYYTYTFTNMTNQECIIMIDELQAKKTIYDQIKPVPGGAAGNILTNLNMCTPTDCILRDIAEKTTNKTSNFHVPRTYGATGAYSGIVMDVTNDKNTSFKDGGYNLWSNYRTVKKVAHRMSPGAQVVYTVAINGFTRSMDFVKESLYFKVDDGVGDSNFLKVHPTFFNKSKFLMVRTIGSQVADGTSGIQTMGIGASLVSVSMTKSMSYRPMLSTKRNAVVRANNVSDVSWIKSGTTPVPVIDYATSIQMNAETDNAHLFGVAA